MKKNKKIKKPIEKQESESKSIKSDSSESSSPKKRKKPQKQISKPSLKNKKLNSLKENEKNENNDMIDIENESTPLKFQCAYEKDPELNKLNLEEIEYPNWLKTENIKDINGRKINDELYDPGTLFIPTKDFEKMSSIFRQYWNIKSKNFDKIIFFKFGLCPMCFYDDALIIGKIMDIRVQFWGVRPFVNIWPKFYKPTIEKLLSLGYKVAIVEQMENESTKKNDIIHREVTEILTKGSHFDENQGTDSKFIMTVIQKKNIFSFVLMEIQTQKFYLDNLKSYDDFKTVVYRVKPVEIVCVRGFIDSEVLVWLKKICNPAFSQLNHCLNEVDEIKKMLMNFFKDGEFQNEFPDALNELFKGFERKRKEKRDISEEYLPNYYLIQAVLVSYNYLEAILLHKIIFQMGSFSFFNLEVLKDHNLYLDSRSLINLELFEANLETRVLESESLFGYINYTKTAFGKRLLKKWLESPLKHVSSINSRLDSVEDLRNNPELLDLIRNKLSKIPDLERNIGRIYSANNKQKLALSCFDSFAMERLGDLTKLLDEFKKAMEIIEVLDENSNLTKNIKSIHLNKLINLKENNGIMPNIKAIIKDIENLFEIREKLPFPKQGICEKFDKCDNEIQEIKLKLNEILTGIKKKLKCPEIIYTSNKIRRYELEIPDKFASKLDDTDFFKTSSRKGFQRFQSPLIESLLEDLKAEESEMNSALTPFFVKVFYEFYKQHSLWTQSISCLSELDCLCSLAIFSTKMKPVSCRPIIVDEDQRVLSFKNCYHPCLSSKNPDFIGNDIEFPSETDVLLITGPNMAGKSTIMRQTCLNIILAQIGSFVNCSSAKLSPIDRIFTRLGANDRILECKSTFYMEMEETSQIVNEATSKSFAIIDELGRGTSTYDGVAIAFGVLKFLLENIKCKTMFATHYHMLVEEFRLFKNIKNRCMMFEFEEEKEEVKFLYKFEEGEAQRSFGINIARMVGLPKEVLIISKDKAENLNKELECLLGINKKNERFNEIVTALDKLDIDN